MASIKDWLAFQKNQKVVPVEQLTMVLNQIDTNAVALKGNNVFTITYSTLANVNLLMTTYYWQLKLPETS